jgi:hypothetical protein
MSDKSDSPLSADEQVAHQTLGRFAATVTPPRRSAGRVSSPRELFLQVIAGTGLSPADSKSKGRQCSEPLNGSEQSMRKFTVVTEGEKTPMRGGA